MKNRTLVSLGALVLMLAVVAYGDYNVLDKTTYYQNATNGSKTDATGNAYTSEASKDRDNWRVLPLINNQLTATASGSMVDSTAIPVATYDFTRMSLLVKINPDSLSSVVRLAVEVRGHYSTATDTSSTFVWHRWPTRPSVGPNIVSAAIVVYASTNTVLHTAAAATSLGAFTHVPVGYLVLGPGIPVGTYVVSKGTSDSALTMSAAATATVAAGQAITFCPPGSISPVAYATGYAGADSIGHMFLGSYAVAQVTGANAPFPNATGIWPGEFVVKYNTQSQDTTAVGDGRYGASPNTMLIPLSDASGAWFMAPYTSIRVRVLSGVRSRVKVRFDLIGVSK